MTGRPPGGTTQACSMRMVPWRRSTWHLWSASTSPRRIWHHAASNTLTRRSGISPATRSTSPIDANSRSSARTDPSSLNGAWALRQMAIGNDCVHDSPEDAVAIVGCCLVVLGEAVVPGTDVGRFEMGQFLAA